MMRGEYIIPPLALASGVRGAQQGGKLRGKKDAFRGG
jgi:hypothetical protein